MIPSLVHIKMRLIIVSLSGQGKRDRCSPTEFAFQPDTPALRFHGQAAKGQPDSGTHRLGFTPGAYLRVFVEDLLCLRFRDARPFVGDTESQVCALKRRKTDPNDRSRRAELDGI